MRHCFECHSESAQKQMGTVSESIAWVVPMQRLCLLSLSHLCSQNAFFHEGSPPHPALPFPFSHKRKKQWSSGAHHLGLGDITPVPHASRSLYRLFFQTGRTTPLIGCDWLDFIQSFRGGDGHQQLHVFDGILC